jgi:FMN reductase
MNLVVLVGNPRPASRTQAAAAAAADAVARTAGLETGFPVIDLSALAPRLLQPEPCALVEDALEQVAGADVLLVASPTYKGTYTGLLKAFLDLLPYRALAGTIALPLLVMKLPQHSLAVEVHLRPLLVELGATVPTPGLALLESTVESGAADEVLTGWAGQVAPALRATVYQAADRAGRLPEGGSGFGGADQRRVNRPRIRFRSRSV